MTFERRAAQRDEEPDSLGTADTVVNSWTSSIPRTLPRKEALAHCSLLDESNLRILLVEAQAGQGKTVLVEQFEEKSEHPFVWLSCAENDMDPRVFCERLIKTAAQSIAGFPEQDILTTISQQLTPDELVEIAAERICNGFEESGSDLTLVFDDAHLLCDYQDSKLLLRKLTARAPSKIRFIIITRFTLTWDSKPLFSPASCLVIDASILTFSREEIALLYNEFLQIPTDSRKVNQLLDATEGWITGLLLLRSVNNIQRLSSTDEMDVLGVLFTELVSASLSPKFRREAALLSLPTELPEALLVQMGMDAVRFRLDDMAARNLFVQLRISGSEPVYRYHHLLRTFLRKEAFREVSTGERSDFLYKSGKWFIENGHIEEGLRLHVLAGDWARISETMQRHCFDFLARNRHHGLMHLLSRIPGDVRDRTPWLCLAFGAGQLALEPDKCLPTLDHALELCRETGDEAGELAAICLLQNYHVTIGGRYGRNGRQINRGADIFRRLQPLLPPSLQIYCAQAIAMGLAYCEFKIRDAVEFLNIARSVPDEETPVFLQELDWCEAVVHGMTGHIGKSLDLMDHLFELHKNIWISRTFRFSIDIMHLNYREMIGDKILYNRLKDDFFQEWTAVLSHSYLASFFVIWDIDLLIAEGRYEEAEESARKELKSPLDQNAHIRSQFLHYQMLAQALQGKHREMDATLRQALRCRAQAGGTFFVYLTQALAGAALSLAGRTRSANRVFDKCIAFVDTRSSIYHAPAVYAYRANMRLQLDDQAGAESDLRRMLNMLKRFGNRHFFGWSPEIMARLLATAVKQGIEPEFARFLARKQMGKDILDNGTFVPLLRVSVLDGLRLQLGDTALAEEKLTPMRQKMLSSLAMSPGLLMDVKEVQRTLWPEDDPVSTQSKFNTMLSRLRGDLLKTFGKEAAQRHFQLSSRKLQLKYCVADCAEITAYSKLGSTLAEQKKLRQAHEAFTHMCLWLGRKFEDVSQIPTMPDLVADKVVQALSNWSELLIKGNDPERALNMLGAALKLNPSNEALYRQQYDLLVSLKRTVEASECLKRCRAALIGDGFSDTEINCVLNRITNH